MKHWLLKAGFALGVGFTAGCAVFGVFEFGEWLIGRPASGAEIAIAVGVSAGIVGWNA